MGKTIISEGWKTPRFGVVVRQIVKDVMTVVKKTKDYPQDEMVSLTLPYALNGDDEYVVKDIDVSFSVEVNITRIEGKLKIESYKINKEDVIEVNIVIDPNYEEQHYQEVYYKLQEDVRHEMEHVLQDFGIGDRPSPEPETGKETTYEHHSKIDEIPAMVQGFYRRAQLQRRPIDEVIIEDLDNEISLGNINKKEAEDLYRLWMNYVKRRFPKAIYSQG